MMKLTKKNLEKHTAYWRPYSTEAKIRDWLHTNPFIPQIYAVGCFQTLGPNRRSL